MAFGTTQADNATTPVSSVYVPGTASSDLTALEGYAPINTDGNSQKSAPASVGIKDGNSASFGAKADSAATSDTGTFSFIALFKRLLQKFPAIGQQTKTASLSVTLASDDGNIGAPGDTAATSDTGTFSLIALFKRLLQGITTSNTNTSNTATNTSTVAGAISSSKMATKAASGDFADGAIATIGLQADAVVTSSASSGTAMAFLKNLATIAGAITSSVMQSNTKQINGTTISINQGTVDAGTQRVAQGGAATGTKSNVVSSATSVTILAANTSRKGAMAYNDSTQILYLDLSGGTASSTSYSVQIPSQSFFELPGPTIYSGAITGIWASANGNARVTEFS